MLDPLVQPAVVVDIKEVVIIRRIFGVLPLGQRRKLLEQSKCVLVKRHSVALLAAAL